MRDDEFQVFKAEIKLKHIDAHGEREKHKMNWCNLQNIMVGKHVLFEKDYKVEQGIFQDMSSFSFNWPYLACTGIGNYLIVIDAHKEK